MDGRQFFKQHYDLLQNPEYLAFVMTPAHITYTFLTTRVYREFKDIPNNETLTGYYDKGWLVARVTLEFLTQSWKGKRSRASVQNDLEWLSDERLIDVYPEPGFPGQLFHLGMWENWTARGREPIHVEHFWIDRVFGDPRLLKVTPRDKEIDFARLGVPLHEARLVLR